MSAMVDCMDLGAARRLLDPQAMTELCVSLPEMCGEGVRQAQLVTLWVKPGRHFNACYRVFSDTPPTPRLVSVCLVGSDRARELAGAGPGRVAAGSFLVQRFPADYRLPTLARCLDPARVGEVGADVPTPDRATPIGYRPGMRCQIRYEGRGETWYGKVAAESVPGQAYAALVAVAQAIGYRGGLRIARPLGYVADLRLTLCEAVSGESLYDRLRARRAAVADVVPAAEALARIHRLDPALDARTYGARDEVELTRGWVGLVAMMFPGLGAGLTSCHAALEAAAPVPAPRVVVVHRDFYDKQVLVAGAEVSVLDFDTACRGDREIDLGNFCAHLTLRGLQWDLGDTPRDLAEGFLRSYGAAYDAVRVAWYRRTALLRLACYYALRPHWRQLAVPLLAEASAS